MVLLWDMNRLLALLFSVERVGVWFPVDAQEEMVATTPSGC